MQNVMKEKYHFVFRSAKNQTKVKKEKKEIRKMGNWCVFIRERKLSGEEDELNGQGLSPKHRHALSFPISKHSYYHSTRFALFIFTIYSLRITRTPHVISYKLLSLMHYVTLYFACIYVRLANLVSVYKRWIFLNFGNF